MKNKNNNEIKTTAHSTYRCQYHIVFAPKFRRQEIYGTLKKDIGEILRKYSGYHFAVNALNNENKRLWGEIRGKYSFSVKYRGKEKTARTACSSGFLWLRGWRPFLTT